MCGIAGLIAKDSESLGSDLINMLRELVHRGRDATGVAIYEQRDQIQARVSMTDLSYEKDLQDIIKNYGHITNSRSYAGEGIFTFFEGSIDMDSDKVSDLNWDIDTHPNLCVHSLGEHIKVYKDQGSVEDLKRRHKIPPVKATHGIGHVRLATESVENINFAHPFISYIYPELAIVHNGQFTNYFNMRRKLQNLGVRFKTNNDSEMAAHFLAYQMKEKGMDLEEALNLALDTFDGVFTLLVSTSDQIGALRDRLGIKPMLFFEQDGVKVLFGSEQICLTPIVSDVYATEMDPGG
ncbi:MAG: glutamine amidotransferase, partial [Gammaproteobacteria bacterium]|nr:glutamine amidotransferase [Gammaproteobacteria bacterium]